MVELQFDKLEKNYYKRIMENPIKKKLSRLPSEVDFEEIDHRLACGWHVEIEGSGQRKRYLRQIKREKNVA